MPFDPLETTRLALGNGAEFREDDGPRSEAVEAADSSNPYQDQEGGDPKIVQLDNLALDLCVRSLEAYGNKVSSAHYDMLRDVALVFGFMASGSITGRRVWTAPAGLGKTRLLVSWVKAMVSLGLPYSVAVCAGRVEELVTIKRELMEGEHPVPEGEIGLWHSLETAAEPPTFTPEEAKAGMYGTRRILLLTHARVQSGQDVARWLQYQGRPRDLVFYDESLLATDVWQASYAPVVGQIKELVAGREDDVAEFLRSLMDALDAEVTSQRRGGEPKRLGLPPHGPELLQKAQVLAWRRSELRSFLQNPEADFRIVVAKNDGAKATLIKPFQTVPIEELSRMVVMDASWPIRSLLKLANERIQDKSLQMKTFEETWHCIKPNFKRYNHVEINVMRTRRSGRQYSIDDSGELGDRAIAREIAAVVASIPADQAVLIWTFKDHPDLLDFERQLRDAIGPRANVFIQTFGRETATNTYKDCSNVIFTGCLELSPEKLAGMYIAESRDLTIPVTSEEIDRLNRGEVWHRVYQGMHRGSCREVFVDAEGQTQAKPMRVWIFTRFHKDIQQELGPVLPGVRWRSWRPRHMSGGLTKEAKGAEVIKDILAKLAAEEKTKVSLKTLKGMHPFLVGMNVKMFQRARNLVLDDEDVGWRLDGRSLARRSVEKRSFGYLEEEEDPGPCPRTIDLMDIPP